MPIVKGKWDHCKQSRVIQGKRKGGNRRARDQEEGLPCVEGACPENRRRWGGGSRG